MIDLIPVKPTEPTPAPTPPPALTAPLDEALRWLSQIAAMAGSPTFIDVSVPYQHIDVSVPSQPVWRLWSLLVGAAPQPDATDELGSISVAQTEGETWSVTIKVLW